MLHGGGSGSQHHAPGGGTANAAREVSQGTQAVDYARHPAKTLGNTYGYVPAWLGTSRVAVSRVVTASAEHPWLAIQGDTVRVELPKAQVLATASGPSTPEQGHFPVPTTSPCTFTVTLTAASAPIAITPQQFATIDEQGRLHTLKVTNLNGGPVPSDIAPGRTVDLKMYAVLPTGQGRIMWAPVAGRKPVVQWDFDVEID